MSILIELVRFIPGCLFFPLTFAVLRRYLRSRFKDQERTKFENTEEVESAATTVAMRLVSSINAVFMIIAGTITVIVTREDKKYDRSPVVAPYCYMSLPYMVYDIYAMFLNYQCEDPSRKKQSLFQAFKSFCFANPVITLHHLMLAFIFNPVYLYFLNGIGDYVVGIFFLSECSTPFLSFRFILRKMKLNLPGLSLANDIILMIVFFFCRVLMIPFCYWSAAYYFEIDFLDVPLALPIKCNVFSAILCSMQLMWFYLILKKACRMTLIYIQHKWKNMTMESNGKIPNEVNYNHIQKVD